MKLLIVSLLLLVAAGCQSTKVIKGEEVPKELKIEHLLSKGEGAYKAGNYEEAKTFFQEVILLDSDVEHALYRLGNIAFRMGDQKSAAQYFTKVIAANPKNAKAHYNLGTIHLMYAEEHMKFFAATAPRDFDISKVSRLLGSLAEFSGVKSAVAPMQVAPETDENLDKLVNLIESK